MIAVAILIAAVTATLQVSLGFLGNGFMTGLWIAALVCSSEVLDFDGQMILAVLLGLILDYYSGADFGLHMVYAVLIVLTGMLVRTSFDHANQRLLNLSVSIGLLVVYSLVRTLPSMNVVSSANWQAVLSSLTIQIVGVIVWFFVIVSIFSIFKSSLQKLSNGVQIKFIRRLVK